MASSGQVPAFGQRRLILLNQEKWDAPPDHAPLAFPASEETGLECRNTELS